MTSSSLQTPGALDGLRVLDLTQAVAEPFCARLLAGYGASVLKIERPGCGDVSRRMGPFLHDRPHPERSGLFLHLNGGKRSITLDLASPSGQALCRELACRADVLIESFRPGVMESWGLACVDLAALRPGLVYASISNFGQWGHTGTTKRTT